MADTPSDGTPDTGAPPPPRRRTRGEPVTTKGSRAKASATRAPKRTTGAAKPAGAKKSLETSAKVPRTAKAAASKPAATKPRAKGTTPTTAAAPKKVGIGKIVAIGAATVAALAAGVAALLGRRKIATVTNETLDSVMGKSEEKPAEPEEKDLKRAD